MMLDKVVLSKEVFALNTVDGLRPGVVSFKTLSMESDRFVCVKDTLPDGQGSLVIVDTERRISERQNIRDAEAAMMSPESRTLALRQGVQLQVFKIDTKERVATHVMSEEIVFWRWLDGSTIAIVTPTAVYHWPLVSPPTKMFDRQLDPNARILNYKSDAAGTWLMLNACSPGPSGLEGKTQLFSVERARSLVLDGFAGTFVTMPTPMDPAQCSILILASSQGLLVKELPYANKTAPMLQLNVPLQMSAPNDFPVVVHGTKHNLVMMATSQGTLSVYDIATGAPVHQEKVSPVTVFAGVPHKLTGGIQLVNNNGSVFCVAIDNSTIISHIKNKMGNTDLALRVASAAGLGGVDDLFRAQLMDLIRGGDAEAAAQVCLKAPNDMLRTPQVLNQFKQMAVQPGAPQAVSTYFKLMLAVGKLNEFESIELAKVVTEKSGNAEYIKQQIEQEKFTLSSGLGEVIEPFDTDLAFRVYFKSEAHAKVLKVLFAKGDIMKAVEYCKRVDYKPDWRAEATKFFQTNPNEAVALARALHRDMGPSPILDPLEVVDMFVSQQQIRNATQFLMDILSDNSGENTAALQTKLFEINIKHSPPSVAEKLFARNTYSNYDGMSLAPLCERAGLHQRAIECYIKAQYQNPDLDNLSNVRRCLLASESFNGEWLIDFFGKLGDDDSLLCLQDLLEHHERHFNSIVQVAIKYSDGLHADRLINMFLEKNLYEMLFAYLGAIVPYTRDSEVHFRYIEAALEVGNIDEVERMTRESPCYDAERTKNLIKGKRLSNLWPFINVCDKYNFIDEMVRYLMETGQTMMIEQYVQRRNPTMTPKVIGALLDCNADESFIQSVLTAAGTMCPVDELVNECESRGRLRLILSWLEARKAERKTDPALYNALGKIYIDTNNNAEDFLTNNQFYDSSVLGAYCENRNTIFAYIAYRRANLDDEVLNLTLRNGMWKELARYLVKRQDSSLWERALQSPDKQLGHIVEAIQQTALPESKVVDEVITAVKAFLKANMNTELTSILDQIVLHGEFRQNRHLENLLIISATKARPDKVMEYVNNLQCYDADDIANIAAGAGLHEVAFTVYDKHNNKQRAASTLLNELNDLPRGRAYALKADEPAVWSVLGLYLLQANEVHEGIDCLVKAKNPNYVKEVSDACERVNQYGDLIKYLMMARVESRNKNPLIDTHLVLTYAKTGRLTELEDFLKDAKGVQILTVADKCFADGLFDSAKVLYQVGSNFPKLAATLIKLGNLPEAVHAAEKAKNIHTWKEVNKACLESECFDLARQCAIHIVLRAEEMNAIVSLYENVGCWDEMASVLKSASANPSAHMGIFTELGVLYARYSPDKLLEHVNLHARKMNTHRMITVCEEYHHWHVLRVLYVINEDWLAAAQVMMSHSADSWDHEVFKDVASRMGSSDVIYTAITFYLQNHPDMAHDYLTSVIKKVDPERVMLMVGKVTSLNVIRPYLETVQERNIKKVNESLNAMFVEEENFSALRKSVDHHNNFDSVELSAQLEKMEMFEFRKIALMLHRRNKRFTHAIGVAKTNKLWQDAIDTAAESGDPLVVESLLNFFIEEKLEECFAAALYTCYEFVPPHVALEKAWKSKYMDCAMPFFIQTAQHFASRLDRLERSVEESKKDGGKAQPKAAGSQLLIK